MGPIEFAPLPTAEREKFAADFAAKTGFGARGIEIDRFVLHVRSAGDVTFPTVPDAGLSDEEIKRLAHEFLKANADAFGLTGSDVDRLQTDLGRSPDHQRAVVGLSLSQPMAGYEGLDLVTNVDLSMGFDAGGRLRFVTAGGVQWPAFSLCTNPELAASDPVLVKSVLRGSASFSDLITNGKRALGEADIRGTPTLVAWTRTTTDHMTVRLAYVMNLGHEAQAFVDANSGEFIEFRPMRPIH